ncbi:MULTISPECIES: hypothetical protein [Sphingobium]|uniref:Uncharacterized protein n=1 Tax=Sphingobium fuliginis (strain ATCC 27551) TaxID=336203 RepID=A0A7M2GE57_SPHSA|nr:MULTISPECIES: hypothetical protein [Sphingobium]QOT70412.1 hypothetical protein H5V43_09560 [Sphingobium fuliginis]
MPPRTVVRRFCEFASVTALALIAGCSTPERKAPPTPPPPVVPTIKPLPPMGAVEEMGIPEVGEDGKYLTPNRGVTANTALWHVRMALNVAALSCHGVNEPARIQYNRILHVHEAALREANAAVDRNYYVAYGQGGLKARELLNTVVYNFFALPPVTKSFCPVAIEVGAKILAMPSNQLLAYAPEALTQLEKPFQEFYAAYADYLRRLAEWQSRFGGTVSVVVSPTPLPPPPTPPREIAAGFAPGAPGTQPSALVPGAPVRVEVPTFPLTPMRETFIPAQ